MVKITTGKKSTQIKADGGNEVISTPFTVIPESP
jgi:hypothetical protein